MDSGDSLWFLSNIQRGRSRLSEVQAQRVTALHHPRLCWVKLQLGSGDICLFTSRFKVSVRASTEWMTKESPGCPDGRRQFGDAMDGECRQTGQDAGQVVTNGDFEAAAAFKDGQNSGHLPASLQAA